MFRRHVLLLVPGGLRRLWTHGDRMRGQPFAEQQLRSLWSHLFGFDAAVLRKQLHPELHGGGSRTVRHDMHQHCDRPEQLRFVRTRVSLGLRGDGDLQRGHVRLRGGLRGVRRCVREHDE